MSQCKNELQITWRITNYSFCDKRNKSCIDSPCFQVGDSDETKWRIRLYPRGFDARFEGCVSLFFVSNRNSSSTLEEDLTVKLLDAKNEVISGPGENVFKKSEAGIYYIFRLMKTEDLEQKIKQSSEDVLVVQCHFNTKSKPDEGRATKKSCTAETIIQFDTFYENWYVRNGIPPDPFIEKRVTQKHDPQFEITLKAPKDDVLIEIRRIGKNNDRDHTVKCQILLLDDHNTEKLSCTDMFFFDSNTVEKNIWNFPSFFKKSHMVNVIWLECLDLRINFFVSNGTFFSRHIEETKDVVQRSPQFEVENPSMDSLKENWLNTLLSNVKYADVKLRVDEEIICAHKLILATRSPVFSAMFDHRDTIENQTGEIDISDIDADTMKQFLKFLYTGMLDELDCERMLALLLAAEKYQVPSLKEKCSQFLISHLEADVICDAVTVADMVGQKVLKQAAMVFIKKHTAKVLGSQKWKEWIKINATLSSEIFCYLSEHFENAA